MRATINLFMYDFGKGVPTDEELSASCGSFFNLIYQPEYFDKIAIITHNIPRNTSDYKPKPTEEYVVFDNVTDINQWNENNPRFPLNIDYVGFTKFFFVRPDSGFIDNLMKQSKWIKNEEVIVNHQHDFEELYYFDNKQGRVLLSIPREKDQRIYAFDWDQDFLVEFIIED